MFGILRAFAWMRWRVLLNSFERTGARDTLERLSLAVEQIGPIIAGALLIPSALILAALGAYTGYSLARGTAELFTFEVLRYFVLVLTLLSLIGPILLPGNDRASSVRLLLLPIPRRTLYVAQAAGAISDPWILLTTPAMLCLPAGLAAGGALEPAAVALAAGILLVLVAIGLSTAMTSIVHLVVRDRRRGELLALLFVVVVPTITLLPGLLDAGHGREPQEAEEPETTVPGWLRVAGHHAFSLTPSELYATATRQGVEGESATAAAAVGLLAIMMLAVHGIGSVAFGHVLESPASGTVSRGNIRAQRWDRTLPGISRSASAVALAQFRLAIRTPRGRSVLLSPLIVFVMLAVLVHRSGGLDMGVVTLQTGVGLAAFGSFVCLLSILPLAMNQFAIDNAGLTLALLSPLDEAELLTGKAVGNAIIAAIPSVLCLLISFILFPAGSMAHWASIPPALVSTYLLVAPPAAALSASFPRVVNLNSIGRRSNAHGMASLVGTALFAAAGAPSLLILLATYLLDIPALAPLLLIIWCAVAFALSRWLFIPARRLFVRRRENLATLM
jgi:hypothetical protein